jgi:hypothetical protein
MSVVMVPLAEAVNWKASAWPDILLSSDAATKELPTSCVAEAIAGTAASKIRRTRVDRPLLLSTWPPRRGQHPAMSVLDKPLLSENPASLI